MEGVETVEIRYENTRMTKTYDVNLLFSRRLRKFVKPVLCKHLCNYYKVLPGVYLLISSGGRNDIDPVKVWILEVKINPDGSEERKTIRVFTVWRETLQRYPEIIRDFVEALPERFHGYAAVDYSKIYSETEYQRLFTDPTEHPPLEIAEAAE